MNYNPVGWFDIPVLDMERAQKFYETLLGIALSRHDIQDYEMSWFPMNTTIKGIGGALMKGMGYTPSANKGTVLYFTCPDIDGTVLRAQEMGSQVILPKKDLGEWGHIAWVTDSEGNIVGLHRTKS